MHSRHVHRAIARIIAVASLLTLMPMPAHANPRSARASTKAAVSVPAGPAGSSTCSSWHDVPGPASGLGAISAAATNDIWAVGTTGQEGGQRGVIAHWDGVRWRAVPSANPPAFDNRLLDVAAVSSNDVWAVGWTVNKGGSNRRVRLGQPLIEHWDGRRWSLVAGPLPSTNYYLDAVAAVSSDDVWAVGTMPGGTRAIIVHWNGRRWRAVPGAPLGPHGGSLYALTAVTANDVWAVGDVVGGNRTALIEHWDGRRWQVSPSPALGPYTSRLDGVTALSSRDVWAAGSYGPNPYNAGGPLIAHWDGTRWRAIPSIDTQDSLFAVAAVSSRDVWATGGSVVEHWDGGRWHSVPAPSGGLGRLAVVASGDIWGLGARFAHYTGHLCYPANASVRTAAVSNVGIQGNDEGTTADSPGALIVDGARGRAFVRDAAGVVSTIDLARATVIQRADLGASGTLAIDRRSGRVFVPSTRTSAAGGNGGSVQVLDGTTGAVTRSFAVGAHPSAVAFDAHSGHLIVAGAGEAQVLDATSGITIATIPISNPTALAVDGRTGRVFVSSHGHTNYDDTGDMGNSPSSLVVLDAVTGKVLRTIAGIGGIIAIDERAGHVFVGHIDSPGTDPTLRVSVLDAATGKVSRTVDIGHDGNAFLAALVLDPVTGEVFIDSYFGLQALDAATGQLRPLYAGAPTAIAIDQHGRYLYATYVNTTNQYGIPVSPGSVAVLDAATGQRLSMLTVGKGPDAVAIDTASGQALVLDQSGVDIVDAAIGATSPARQPSPADPVAPSAARPGARYFPQTHHTLAGPFLTFWARYGSVDTFGYPRSEPFVRDARLAQYTDRALLRMVDGQVVPAPLGRLLTVGRRFAAVAPFRSTHDRLYFPATRHSLSGRFLDYWRSHHGPLLLGAPLSEVVVEGNGDGSGRRYPLQWFERGRLEYHAKLAGTRYAVELGLLGLQALRGGI